MQILKMKTLTELTLILGVFSAVATVQYFMLERANSYHHLETNTRIDGLEIKLTSVESSLTGEINSLESRLTGVESNLTGEINSLDSKLSGEINSLETQLFATEGKLLSEIKGLEVSLSSKIDSGDGELNSKIEIETAKRKADERILELVLDRVIPPLSKDELAPTDTVNTK